MLSKSRTLKDSTTRYENTRSFLKLWVFRNALLRTNWFWNENLPSIIASNFEIHKVFLQFIGFDRRTNFYVTKLLIT